MTRLNDTLALLAQGRRPADDGLLGNCRLEWSGGEAYGEEAILESFRVAPLDLANGVLVSGDDVFAWVGADSALVGDLYDGRIGRLWRVGSGETPIPEPAVAVAFDPDLSQQRGGLHIRREDHRALDAGSTSALVAAIGTAIEGEALAGLHRARAFVVRALSADGASAALCSVHRLGGGAVRDSGFSYAVVLVSPDGTSSTVHDHRRLTEWTPRL